VKTIDWKRYNIYIYNEIIYWFKADLGPGWGKTGFYPVELVLGTTQGEVIWVGYLG
jgi:hypothetical protein